MADENNIGASRLLGTNGLQQAVDSLASQVSKLTNAVSGMSNNVNRNNGTSNGSSWNSRSNRTSYSSNGGGATFSGGGTFGSNGRGNGGGGFFTGSRFGGAAGGARVAGTLGAGAAVLSGLTQYANKNMSSNMQMDYFGTQSAIAGGFTGGVGGPRNLATIQAFANQYGALSAQDAAQAGYISSYTFGNSQFNGRANPAFTSGAIQVGSFAYANPTLGAAAAATAAQQTYTARSALMSNALGLTPTIGMGGQKASMSDIAQSIYRRTFGNQNVSMKGFNAAVSQNGSMAVNLQYFGQQLGWNQSTQQEYQGILQGQVAAQNKGMNAGTYYQLLGKAQVGDKTAMNQLAKTTGMGTSMFENQRNLNATNLTRQQDILQSLAPAFDDATQAVNKFSGALTAVLKATGLDTALGASSGFTAPFSNAVGGASNGFGTAAGIYGAMRLFGGAGGLGKLLGRSAATTAATAVTNGASAASVAEEAAAVGGGIGATTVAALAIPAAVAVAGANGPKPTPTWFQAAKMRNWSRGHPGATLAQKRAEEAAIQQEWAAMPVGQQGGSTQSGAGGGNSLGNGSSNVGASAAQVIGFAETQLGVDYVWGGETPGKAMDCSGLTQWAYGKAGVNIPRVAADQQKASKPVDKSKTQPGDLLFVGNPAHHVVMSIGGGKIIEAPHPGAKVRIRPLNPGEFDTAGRYVGNVGDLSSLLNGAASPTTGQTSPSGGDMGGGLGGTSELATIMAALAGGLGGGATSAPAGSTSSSATSSPASGTSGASPAPTGNGSSALQAYAKQLLASRGWGSQWASFNALEMSEAGWDITATNPSSGAYGLPQALPPGKMASAGSDWKTNGDTQLNWMMGYIADRYGSPDAAWAFHQKNNWYASGAWSIDQDQSAQVHKGEMILPAKQAETIRSAITNMMTTGTERSSGGGGLTISSINVNLPAGYTGTAAEAKTTGKMIVDAVTSDDRIKRLQMGQ